ncbi:hypothetical protein OJF2_73710 [Aquisphaera giovannonii]|uniref:Uncharacterized protein n=1 Tax=Aquisphaera giovannonii TaxID=406548 RepID=A0A5B9WFC5_9BACT|nr:hypothetical protein [Aquisphaera giovannonii]QEH38765.1 hypothetical protein OJF2_73710 [Aquisphaera giovannonii]
MPNQSLRSCIGFCTVSWTLITLIVDAGFAASFSRGLVAGRPLRGADLITLLFFVPFNAIAAFLCVQLFGRRVLPVWTAFLRARRHPLTSGGLAAMAALLPVLFVSFARADISLMQAVVGWVAVLSASVADYRMSPLPERLGDRNRLRPAQPALPSRRPSREAGHRPPGLVPSVPLGDTAAAPTGVVVTNRLLLPTGESSFAARPDVAARLEAIGCGSSPPRGRTQDERLDDLERKLDRVLRALDR